MVVVTVGGAAFIQNTHIYTYKYNIYINNKHTLNTPNSHLELGHDIGAVQVVGDAAEALRLALRAVGGPGAVEARELKVGVGADAHLCFWEEGGGVLGVG